MTNAERLKERNVPRIKSMHSIQIQAAYEILIQDTRFLDGMNKILQEVPRDGYITDAELRVIYTTMSGTLMVNAALDTVMGES
jgi:hypothetical protein